MRQLCLETPKEMLGSAPLSLGQPTKGGVCSQMDPSLFPALIYTTWGKVFPRSTDGSTPTSQFSDSPSEDPTGQEEARLPGGQGQLSATTQAAV